MKPHDPLCRPESRDVLVNRLGCDCALINRVYARTVAQARKAISGAELVVWSGPADIGPTWNAAIGVALDYLDRMVAGDE